MILSRPVLGLGALIFTAIAGAAQYVEIESYDPSNFFQKFDFVDEDDPTHGFVNYVDAVTADASGLAGLSNGGVYLGSDYTNVTSGGRDSVRVTSKRAYTRGLFIADIAHMPVGTGNGGSCGLWPAFWMFGPGWPSSGEMDIIEGVNNQATNAITLHTSDGCSMSNPGSLPSTELTNSNCEGHQGCGQSTAENSNFGPGFNAIGGGIYALEWTNDAISVWFFPRNDPMVTTLNTLNESSPDPSTFGQPLARFVGNSCNIDSHFVSNSLVFNIDYCGDWAGNVWDQDSTCSQLAPTCNEYVGNNPEAFAEAYWLVNSIKVYSKEGLLGGILGGDGLLGKRGRTARKWRA